MRSTLCAVTATESRVVRNRLELLTIVAIEFWLRSRVIRVLPSTRQKSSQMRGSGFCTTGTKLKIRGQIVDVNVRVVLRREYVKHVLCHQKISTMAD